MRGRKSACHITIGFVLLGLLVSSGTSIAGTKLFKATADDFDGMAKRRLVRIIVPFSKTLYFVDKGRAYGTSVTFANELEAVLNKDRKKEIERIRIAFIPVPRDDLLTSLKDGLGDVVMANLTITPSRLDQVDFTVPVYDKASEVLVTGPSTPSTAMSSPADLGGKEVFVRTSSSYYEHLEMLNVELTAAGKPEVVIHPIDENLEDEDLMEMVNAGLLPYIIVDHYKAEIWSKVFTGITVHPEVAISTDGKIAWAIRKNSPLLKDVLDRFVSTHRVGTTFGNMLRNKFFKSDKIVKQAYSPADAERFEKLVAIFRKFGAEYSFDYLMLAAQGYQESQLDQTRRSPRGAVGIMQMLPKTAKDKAVNIADIDKDQERNIEAGAKYLRHLIDTYIPGDLTARDRQLLAFAAYNAGPGNLRKFRQKAVAMGLSPDVWFGNVENAAAEIVGRETVQYVSNIYKYYVAYSLLTEQASDRKKALVTMGQD